MSCIAAAAPPAAAARQSAKLAERARVIACRAGQSDRIAAVFIGCDRRRAGVVAQRRRLEQGGRGLRLACRATSDMTVIEPTDYATLQGFKVYSASSGEAMELPALWQPEPGTRCVVAFLTHFADLSSTEFAQKLLPALPQLQGAGVGLIVVGLGETEKARRFAELLDFPLENLYADPSGELYRALGFNPGFLPDTQISPYAKLLGMLAGVGSPGTIQEVLRGYAGDRTAKPVFSGPSNLFDVLGSGYQRPLELATLRLYNMGLVLSHWNELAPADEQLLTLQGGCLAFDGRREIFRHVDSGILKYADVESMLGAVLPAGAPAEPAATQVLRPLL